MLSVILLVSMQFTANAWGRRGHKLVVEIAYSMLDNQTKTNVQQYLDGMTAEQVGNWMDDMRSNHNYDFMKPWHYVNTEKGETYQPTKEPNLINALNDAISALEHKDKLSKEDIKKNILIISHLTGDLHQPLHVGYGSDKGGNDIQVKYLNKETNLHKVWDTEIIESEDISLNDCLLQLNGFNKPMLENFKVINPEKWSNQPRALLSGVYNFKNSTIDQAYIDRNKKIVEEQLLIAGIRLSAVLQHLFKA